MRYQLSSTDDGQELPTEAGEAYVVYSRPHADTLNETLRKLMRQVQQLLDDNPSWSAQQLRAGLDGNGAAAFLSYLRLEGGHPRRTDMRDILNHHSSSDRGLLRRAGTLGAAPEGSQHLREAQ